MVRSFSTGNPSERLTHIPRGDISAAEKKAYIDAFLCVIGKPSKLDRTKFPGAQTRYDDFVVVHMNQTMNIHGTVSLPSSVPSGIMFSHLGHRPTSCRGTATTSGRGSAFSARSATSRVFSRYVPAPLLPIGTQR